MKNLNAVRAITVTTCLKNKKACKNAIEKNGCKLVYNRALGGYQVTKGFTSSEVEYPTVDLILNSAQLERLYSYSTSVKI